MISSATTEKLSMKYADLRSVILWLAGEVKEAPQLLIRVGYEVAVAKCSDILLVKLITLNPRKNQSRDSDGLRLRETNLDI